MSDPDNNDLLVFEESGVGKQSPLLGRRLADRYEILSELGRGGMGVVYLAEDRTAQSRVAVKMLSGPGARSEDLRSRFRREAETASKVSHPGICGVRDFGEFEGLLYLVMDYVQGTSLGDIIEKAQKAGTQEDSSPPDEDPSATFLLAIRPMGVGRSTRDATRDHDRSSVVSVDHMVRLIEKAARALHFAHEAGLIHRDIKPANIMVTPEGDPVLLDFGLARDLTAEGQTLTESGQILGTPAYLAPEQIKGRRVEVDRRTDIYAMGISLYECLTLERPIQGDSRDHLFHNILTGDWTPPGRLNPRIPPDLCTVVEKAMDRDPARRYATAADFADDLGRVRAFKRIHARRPGPAARFRRWAGRRPGKAAAAAAAAIIVLAGTGFLVQQKLSRVFATRAKHVEAEALLAEGKFTEALEVLAQARDLGLAPEIAGEMRARIERGQEQSRQAERRGADLAAAGDARAESAEKQKGYAAALAGISTLRLEVDRERSAAFATAASDAARGSFAAKEGELRRCEADADRLLAEAYEALERAARREAAWGDPTPTTQKAFGEYYLARWREAVARRDDARAERLKATVRSYDKEGRHEQELLGRGILEVTAEPPGAEVFLFRYESHEAVRPGRPIPRLVPVPTTGIGRSREGPWIDDFHTGDPCLVVTAVEDRTLAASEGLRTGDLIVSLNGSGTGDGVIVQSVAPEAGTGAVPVPVLGAILAVNGIALEGHYDWEVLPSGAPGERDRLRLAGQKDEVLGDRQGLTISNPRRILESPAPAAMTVGVLRGGSPVKIGVPEGTALGVRCEATAYPLIAGDVNRIRAGPPIDIDPGSYLLWIRHPGFEDQRFAVEIPRGARRTIVVSLLLVGATPAGFIFVPPGPFRQGGDPAAIDSGAEVQRDLPGFVIARFELTIREWFEFVNDEETLAKIEAASGRSLLPRDTTRLLARKAPDGKIWEAAGGSPASPVLGISWNDVQEYLRCRNRKAEEAGEPWTYDLPTREEWEKAARGVDGRHFTWGDRFDFALCVSPYRKGQPLHSAPGGFEPRDESPYGIRDLAGSHLEWTKDRSVSDPQAPPRYIICGGAWGMPPVDAFRAAKRAYADANYVSGNNGVRLVIRPRL